MGSGLELTGSGGRRRGRPCLEVETYWRWVASVENLKVVACWLEAALGLLMVETCLMREGAWEMMSWVAKLAWEASLRKWVEVGAAQLALLAPLGPFPL